MDTLWPFYNDVRKDPEPGRPRPRSTNSEISCVPSAAGIRKRQEDDGNWSLNPFSFISASTITPESQQQSSEDTSGLFFVPYFYGTTPSEKKNENAPSSSSSSSTRHRSPEYTPPQSDPFGFLFQNPFGAETTAQTLPETKHRSPPEPVPPPSDPFGFLYQNPFSSSDTTTTTTPATNESYLWPFTSSSPSPSSSEPTKSKPSRRKDRHKDIKEENTTPLIPFLPFLGMSGMGNNVSISSPGTSIVGHNPSFTLSDVGVGGIGGGGGGGGGDKSSTANNSVVSKSSAFDFKGSPRRNHNHKIWPSDLPGGEEWTPFTSSQKEAEFAEHKAMPMTNEDKEKDHSASSSSSSGISHLLWPNNWTIENQPNADAKADLRNDTQSDLRNLRTDLRAVSDLRLVSTTDKTSPRPTKKNTFHIPKEESD